MTKSYPNFDAEEVKKEISENYKEITGESFEGYSREEILNNDDVRRNLEEQVRWVANYAQEYIDFNGTYQIAIDGRLKRSMGSVGVRDDGMGYKIKFNPDLFQVGKKGLAETVIHELAHLETKEGDDSYKFKNYCKDRNIPLQHDFGIKEYYVSYCKSCGKEFGKRTRKSKIIKSIVNDEGRYYCTNCESRMLDVKHIKFEGGEKKIVDDAMRETKFEEKQQDVPLRARV